MSVVISFLLAAFVVQTAEAKDGDIRLAWGNGLYKGRVEVRYAGIWGTVCDDGWDLKDANVVCRQLGLPRAVAAKLGAAFGRGSGPIWMDDVRCTGNETSLTECGHRGWGSHNCHHGEDAGVICFSGIRLLEGKSSKEGLIQVYYNKTWGWVCADKWDKRDADVACRMMDFDGSLSATLGHENHTGIKFPIWFRNMQCIGSESNIFACVHDGWRPHDCERGRKAGVVCRSKVRLVGNDSVTSGDRVEVFHSGTWGTVCADFWDFKDANVVCREQGFEGAVTAAMYTKPASGREIQRIRWVNNIQCMGNETSLTECKQNEWRKGHCSSNKDAGVVCITARLVRGRSPGGGLVQVYFNKTWGWVCADQWDQQEADVACRMMDFDGSLSATFEPEKQPGKNFSVLINNMQCTGNETSLFACVRYGLGSDGCEAKRIAGVLCRSKVRLVGSDTSYQGRVEVFYNGDWGSVCPDKWDLKDANVVCRQLGFEGAMREVKSAGFGGGKRKPWIDDVQCAGNESSLGECEHERLDRRSGCWDYASVVCIPGVRLVGGGSKLYQGRVEVFFNGTWGKVCNDLWDQRNANVVCRQLGFDGAVSTAHFADYDKGQRKIWMSNVQCTGKEGSLIECDHSGWGESSCGQGKDAGVVCTPAGLRLVGGKGIPHQGRVEVFYNGTWGTVCGNNWDLRDANVTCRQLGLEGAIREVRNGAFGRGNGVIWMNRVNCNGYHSSLQGCYHNGWGQTGYCSHYRDVGVECIPGIRLVGRHSSREGLLQIYYNKTWGWVCADQWDKQDADVACRMMGFNGSLLAGSETEKSKNRNIFLWISNVQCFGNESSILSCAHIKQRSYGCAHDKIASTVCRERKVLLTNGNSARDGRFEILFNGFWGTVCGTEWDLREASVACRQLGYDGAVAAIPWPAFGGGREMITMDRIQCIGYESSISDCRFTWWKSFDCRSYGRMSGHPGAVCSPAVRLVGGRSSKAGSVQVYHRNAWGWLCGQEWDQQGANVVCRELGYERASAFYVEMPDTNYGDAIWWLNNVQCVGNEPSIFSCPHYGWNAGSCESNKTASVVCTGAEVRLVKGTVPFRGQVEVLHAGDWRPVCSYGWDLRESHVVCRQLGYNGAKASADGQVTVEKRLTARERILLDNVQCDGNETSIAECKHGGLGVCWYGITASLACNPEAAPLGKPQLVSGDYYSIAIRWRPTKPSIYRVQKWNINALTWGTTTCRESSVVGTCLVYSPWATVNGLEPSRVYYFRIYVMDNVTSPSSGPLQTRTFAPLDEPSTKPQTTMTSKPTASEITGSRNSSLLLPSVIVLGVLLAFTIAGVCFLLGKQRRNLQTEKTQERGAASGSTARETEASYFELRMRVPQERHYQELHYASDFPEYHNIGEMKRYTSNSPEYQNIGEEKPHTGNSPEYQNIGEEKPHTINSPEY